MRRSPTHRQGEVFKFLLVGIANTVAGLTIIYAAKAWAELDDVRANALGYGCAVLLSFALNKNWTFRFGGATAAAFGRFLLVFGAAYAANLAAVLLCIGAGLDGYVAQALGIAPYTVVFYVGSRCYAFATERK